MRILCVLLFLLMVLGCCCSDDVPDTVKYEWMDGTVVETKTQVYQIRIDGISAGWEYHYSLRFADGRMKYFRNQPQHSLEAGGRYVIYFRGDRFIKALRNLGDSKEPGAPLVIMAAEKAKNKTPKPPTHKEP